MIAGAASDRGAADKKQSGKASMTHNPVDPVDRLAATLLMTMAASVAPSSLALAADAVYGAGATLPAPVLRDVLDCIAVPVEGVPVVASLPVDCVAAPAFKDDVTHLYAAVGSGNGRNAFIARTTPFVVPEAGEPTFTTAAFQPTLIPTSTTRSRRRR